MDWLPLASTGLGALIALLATAINERFKWRREQLASRRLLRRQTYSSFLTALTDAHEQMRAEMLTDHSTPSIRTAAVVTAFRTARCYQLRYELAIVAEQDVLNSAEKSFRVLREIRDFFSEGGDIASERYRELRHAYTASLRELQLRMRVELGAADIRLADGS